jgi:MraZ protein
MVPRKARDYIIWNSYAMIIFFLTRRARIHIIKWYLVVKTGGKGRGMTSFWGKYNYSLDPKGRIIVPAPLRDIIFKKYNNSKLYITNALFDKCLHLYPLEEWNRLEEKIQPLPKSEEAVKYFLRRVIASVLECELDKQGRVLIPVSLREDAGINGEVVIVGPLEKIEIWDKTGWDEVTDPKKVDVKAYEKVLASYGL